MMAILVSEGRPVLYRQKRVGRYGEPFTMLKFRSMVADAHNQLPDLQGENERTGPLFKIHKDPRVTKVGRFLRYVESIDDLPRGMVEVIADTGARIGEVVGLRWSAVDLAKGGAIGGGRPAERDGSLARRPGWSRPIGVPRETALREEAGK